MSANESIDFPLGVKAKAHARRAGAPWRANLRLSPGPHLFLDWRFVMPGELGLIGPYWASEDHHLLPTRVYNHPLWKDRPLEAHYVPQDVPQGIRIVAQKAEKGEPFPDQEPPGTRILWDSGIYRTWYFSWEVENPGPLRYAESEDGLSWQPRGECVFDWSACPEIAGNERPEVFLDPSAPEEERFKMFFRAGIPGGEEGQKKVLEEYRRNRPEDVFPTFGESRTKLAGMYGAVSPDGLHWKGLPGPLVIHYSDTTNVVYYDQRLQRYVWFARCNWYYGRRCIGRAETDDFRRWPGPELLLWPSTDLHPTDDWYTNSKTHYPGTVDHHLMFPALYHHADDTTELRLFSSPDGLVWSEVPGGAVLETGTPGTWDGGCIFGGLDLIPLPGDRVALPFVGYPYPHKYPRNRYTFTRRIAYAMWPKGRLGALEAPETGSFTTLPLVFEGGRLRLNLQTKRAGHVLVEVADRDGNPLPGHRFDEADPIIGDHFDHLVTWKGNPELNTKPDQPVLLRFRMRCAQLFGFEFV